jgi:uncharacterized protein YecT (DUF1311 family)
MGASKEWSRLVTDTGPRKVRRPASEQFDMHSSWVNKSNRHGGLKSMAVKSLYTSFFLSSLVLMSVACSRPTLGSTSDPQALTPAKATPENGESIFRPSFADCSDKSDGVTTALQACMETEYQYQEARLQAAYQTLLRSQSQNSRHKIEKSQADWFSGKEKSCAWDAVHGGQAQRLEADYCNLQSTTQRAIQLEQDLKSAD